VQGSHLVIASLHAGLGDLHFDQNRFTDAKKQYEEAIQMAKMQLRDEDVVANSLVIAGYAHDLAVVCEELQEYEDALAIARQKPDLSRLDNELRTEFEKGAYMDTTQ